MRRPPMLAAGLGIPLALTLLIPGGAAALPGDSAPSEAPGASFFLTEESSAPPEDIARDLLRLKADQYGVSAADLADLQVLSQHTSSHNGVTYVNLVQRYQGRDVYGGVATVSVTKDGVVLHVAESLVGNLREATGKAALDAPQAVASAATELDLEADAPRVLTRSGGAEQETTVSTAGISAEKIPARLVWQPTEEGLRLAWEVVIDEADSHHLWQVMVDAESGEALTVDDWTDSHDAGSFTGLARSPQQFAQGAVAASSGTVLGSPTPVADGSSYRVLAFPKESPNDGDRVLVTNPADAVGSPFGWHDTNGVAGPEHTTTRGNNVHAYTDQDANNQVDPGSDPDGGAGLTFDFPMDLREHAQTYREAAVTNLFYVNNVIHDVLYRYGFDEASGNFQRTNYTGVGNGGDDVAAEAADGNGTNNANFSTPAADGGRPRMQMYLWPGNQFGAQNGLTLGTGADAVTYGANYARFTPAPTNAGLPGTALVVDNACVPFAAPGAVVITANGGACNAHTKVRNAEDGGAVAVVITHNTDAAAPILTGSMNPAVGIPAVSVSQADGVAIREQVAAGATAASVHKMASHPGIRDGDLENGIIIHEYGHGVSNRLTGGLNINCLSGNEQMGEGWSDYLAITMLLDPALDNPEQARGMGPYALFQPDRHGAGIRPAPYSRNMSIQPFTYDRIKTNGWVTGASLAAPHGIGHAWASILWDLDWDLIDKHGFTADIYAPWNTAGNTRALQYVMDGMKMQGCGPGFVAGRNGILAASEALGGADTCNIWATFARRGVGYSAIQGTTNRDDNTEAFDVPPTCKAAGAGVKGGAFSADRLNVVEAGDTAPVKFSIAGDFGLDILRGAHSPSSQEIDCTTLQPKQYALTFPTQTTGARELSYSKGNDLYHYNWKTDEAWGGSCRQLIITLEDGKQHRANFRFVEES